MSCVAVIPARYGSTRFPGKVLAPLHGKPLIQHVWERARLAEGVDRVLVATDDERVAGAVRGFGGESVMTPPELPSGTDRVAYAVGTLRVERVDVVINVQGDEPLIMPQMLAQVVQPLLDERSINVTNAITQIVSPADYLDATVVKAVKDKKGDLLYLTRSPIPFPRSRERFVIYKQIGLYAFRRPFLRRFVQMEQTDLELVEGIEFLRLLENGYRVRAVISQYNPISVDTISDLKEVEKIMKKDKSTHPQ